MSSYLERSSMIFYSGSIRNEYVSFVPAVTINCNPPYVEGKRDGCWISYNPKIWKPDFKLQADCERLVGMNLQPLN